MTSHPVHCRCGRLTGEISDPGHGIRGVCYCRDCQAFAHFLGARRHRVRVWAEVLVILLCVVLHHENAAAFHIVEQARVVRLDVLSCGIRSDSKKNRVEPGKIACGESFRIQKLDARSELLDCRSHLVSRACDISGT